MRLGNPKKVKNSTYFPKVPHFFLKFHIFSGKCGSFPGASRSVSTFLSQLYIPSRSSIFKLENLKTKTSNYIPTV